MTTHSLIPMASRHRGVDMPELCASLVRAAMARASARPTQTGARTAADASCGHSMCRSHGAE
jgi:hypothetical protein